jgi:hypothetical protein
MSIRRLNALHAFDRLVIELAVNKRKWTPAQRLLYNRVLRFLQGPRLR